ncbi:hypothetical protein [Desulforhopalus sp. 52FAK]
MREAHRAIFQYIEVYCNRKRKHSANSYKSPSDYWNKRTYIESWTSSNLRLLFYCSVFGSSITATIQKVFLLA